MSNYNDNNKVPYETFEIENKGNNKPKTTMEMLKEHNQSK